MDIILGAGATGLSYAAMSNQDYIILEASSSIGGYCKTVKQDGFVWDYSGHFFHFRDQAMKEMVMRHMSDEDILTCRKKTQILYRERYIDFPFQKNIHQLEQQEFIDCLYDLFCLTGTAYDNFKGMLYSKFGPSIAEKFLIPYNEKLYACDLNSLDLDAMGRFFPYADKEEIVHNFKENSNHSYNDTFIYPRGGAIEYINSLARSVSSDRIHLNEAAIKIDPEARTVSTAKGSYQYDHLISTIPLPQLLARCNLPYEPSTYSWNKVLVFNLGFDRPSPESFNNWVYFPGKESVFYRVGFYDRIFNDPRMSLYVEIGYPANATIDIVATKARVLRDLEAVGIISGHKLISACHILMDPAYVHISTKSLNDVVKQKERLAQHGIYSIGRYGSWTYCSIEDGMLEARELSHQLNKRYHIKI